MSDETNGQWLLSSRPRGMVEPGNFEYRESELPTPGEGEFLVRNLYLSIDPAMRGWMSETPSYIPPVGIGEVMRAGAVGEVLRSSHPGYAAGDRVLGGFGWQEYAVSDGRGMIPVTKLAAGVPPTLSLSALGMTSLTAYWGLREIGQPRPGETVLVSGAAGATGSVVGQIAQLRGCRAVGIAGGPEKCAWLTEELGFDAAIDYRSEDVRRRVADTCRGGVDVFFDNVGAELLEAALANLAMHGRIVLCGAIASYNAERPPPGPSNYMQLLVKRGRMQGFLVFDFAERNDEAMAELVPWVMEGRIRYREDIREGLRSAPSALVDLFTGANLGKLLVHIADPA